jgi:hypothetical protein
MFPSKSYLCDHAFLEEVYTKKLKGGNRKDWV